MQRASKDKTASGSPFNFSAAVDFSNQLNSRPEDFPLNTGHPFANALLGYYASYEQANSAPAGLFPYANAEGYGQDLWRVNSRLVLNGEQAITFNTREGNYFVFRTPPQIYPTACEPIAGRPNACLKKVGRARTALGSWFGEPNAARDPRVIQLYVKLYF